jgi:hypothetical protein
LHSARGQFEPLQVLSAAQFYMENLKMEYYDLKRNWRRVRPHLADNKLTKILVRDFNKFTFGRWGRKFTYGHTPSEFDSSDWRCERRGRPPHFWRYTCSLACHWLVNFNLRLATLVMPDRRWRILNSAEHSTVCDGGDMIFEFNFQAFGIDPDECFAKSRHRELLPGQYLPTYPPPHWTADLPKQQETQL